MKNGLEIGNPLGLHHCRTIGHADVATTRDFTRTSIVDALIGYHLPLTHSTHISFKTNIYMWTPIPLTFFHSLLLSFLKTRAALNGTPNDGRRE